MGGVFILFGLPRPGWAGMGWDRGGRGGGPVAQKKKFFLKIHIFAQLNKNTLLQYVYSK